jgi:hypothetical protein
MSACGRVRSPLTDPRDPSSLRDRLTAAPADSRSEHSRLPVITPIREARRLETIFADAVCAALRAGGVASDDIADERSRMSTIAFGKTRSRSLLAR